MEGAAGCFQVGKRQGQHPAIPPADWPWCSVQPPTNLSNNQILLTLRLLLPASSKSWSGRPLFLCALWMAGLVMVSRRCRDGVPVTVHIGRLLTSFSQAPWSICAVSMLGAGAYPGGCRRRPASAKPKCGAMLYHAIPWLASMDWCVSISIHLSINPAVLLPPPVCGRPRAHPLPPLTAVHLLEPVQKTASFI